MCGEDRALYLESEDTNRWRFGLVRRKAPRPPPAGLFLQPPLSCTVCTLLAVAGKYTRLLLLENVGDEIVLPRETPRDTLGTKFAQLLHCMSESIGNRRKLGAGKTPHYGEPVVGEKVTSEGENRQRHMSLRRGKLHGSHVKVIAPGARREETYLDKDILDLYCEIQTKMGDPRI